MAPCRRKDIDRDRVRQQYFEEEKSLTALAHQYGCSKGLIQNAVEKDPRYNTKERTAEREKRKRTKLSAKTRSAASKGKRAVRVNQINHPIRVDQIENRHLTEELSKQILSLYDQTHDLYEICTQLKCPLSLVTRAIKRSRRMYRR